MGKDSADRGLLRSLNMKARIQGDERFRIRERKAWETLYPALLDLIVSRLEASGHPDPVRKAKFGFAQMFFTMREMLLWEPLRTGEACDTRSLVVELSRALLAYLALA